LIRVIDIETTGTDPVHDDVIEIASVDMVRGGGITNAMDTLVRPSRPIPPGASAAHHLIDADVQNAPLVGQAIERFKGADFYVAHNAAFEQSFSEGGFSFSIRDKSIVRAVIFSTAPSGRMPTRPRPRAVSAISARIRSRPVIFLATIHLHQFVVRDRPLDRLHARAQQAASDLAPILQFVRLDVVALALGEAVQEHTARSPDQVGKDRPVAAPLTLAFARHPLLDQAAAEVGIDQPVICPHDGIPQHRVR
jgi:hypothetical protein